MAISYLTKEGFENLQKELDELRNKRRKEIATRLQEALEDGELIEQAFVEGRIKELEMLLANAKIIDEAEREPGAVHVGSTVVIQEEGQEPETYMVVGPAEADPRLGKISNESPIGRALLNHKAGDRVKVDAPGGAYTVVIVKVS